jgi:hypothetical protein
METSDEAVLPKTRLKKRHIFGGILVVLLALLVIAWWQRFTIADRLVKDQLKEAGVRATYKIKDIGFRTQRLTNIVIGDPKDPDLTARLVEINMTIGFGKPVVRSIWAEGVAVKGRFADGKLKLGELDKFRDLDSKKPFELPDLNIGLRRFTLSLQTPWGPLGVGVEGQGHMQRSFTGTMAMRSGHLIAGGCGVSNVRVDGEFVITNSQPTLNGPAKASALRCADLGLFVSQPNIDGEFRLNKAFDRWLGDAAFSFSSVQYKNHKLIAPAGEISFDGGLDRTNYQLALTKARYIGKDVAIAKIETQLTGDITAKDKGVAITMRGGADLTGGNADTAWLNGLASLARNTAGTPVGPVLAQLGPAINGVFRSFAATMELDGAVDENGRTTAVFDQFRLTSASGAKIEQSAPIELRNGALHSGIKIAMAGGGLPHGTLLMTRNGSAWAGTLALASYAANGASVHLPKLGFNRSAYGDWRFSGQALLSGPLIGGQVKGLSLPIDGRWSGGRFSLLTQCSDLRFQSFNMGTFSLPGQALRACPSGGPILQAGSGGTRFAVALPAVAGNAILGGTPIHYAGSQVRFSLDKGFVASNVTVDMGRGDNVTSLKMATLDGRFVKGGFSGAFSNGSATIGSVPILAENANGRWSYIRNNLELNAALTVSDAEQVDRFRTLNVPDLALVLENGVISAIGHLHEPTTGIAVSDVDIMHNLSNGSGRALLAADGLVFGDRLEPSMLTPLIVGAIANVKGMVNGDARIEWDASGVRSKGKFDTAALNFDAAFGPVDGLSTEVSFTDLLNLETAPMQIARLATVNPGIPAFDGQIRYRLLPGQRLEIEEGRWPFYGGELILESTILDFNVESKRNLTFRMVGLDAEKFLAGYEFDNLAVKGVFDGTLPMVFDQEGGRIVGGWLVSRKGGGEVSYLGQISYQDMGFFANYAFGALRSIKFDEMQIGVEGNIGGEVITEVRFRGLQQGSLAERNFITKQIAKIPIEFNVRIQAQFLQLIGNLRALYDPEFAAKKFKAEIDARLSDAVVPGEGDTK